MNTPKADGFLYSEISDEELLTLKSKNDSMAEHELCRRYLKQRKYCLFLAHPVLFKMLDELSQYDAFINALSVAISKYSKKMKCTFKTYLISVLRNEMLKSVKDFFFRSSIVSLDEDYYDANGDSYCLRDVIPVERNMTNTPILYVNSQYIEAIISEMSRYHQRITRRLIDYIVAGYSVVEACSMIPITYAKGRYILEKLINTLKDSDKPIKRKKKKQR